MPLLIPISVFKWRCSLPWRPSLLLCGFECQTSITHTLFVSPQESQGQKQPPAQFCMQLWQPSSSLLSSTVEMLRLPKPAPVIVPSKLHIVPGSSNLPRRPWMGEMGAARGFQNTHNYVRLFRLYSDRCKICFMQLVITVYCQ
jgi:hypothetical protein